MLRLRVFHEGLPNESSARVFCHEHGDASVDADDVSVIPFLQWVEGIDETVAAPRLGVMGSDVLEDTHGGLGQKRKRASGGRRNYGSIDGAHRRWSAPDYIAFVGVRGTDAPEVIAIVRKTFAQFDAEASVNFGGGSRVLKIICV